MVAFILIFFIMIIVVGTITIAGFSLLLRRRAKRLREDTPPQIDEPPPVRSLFEPSEKEIADFEQAENARMEAARRETRRQDLLERARRGDMQVLLETKPADSALYQELLARLTAPAADDSNQTIRLANFVSDNKIPANETLARNVLEVWKKDASAIPTAKVLHISALSGSAENYAQTIDEIAAGWKEKKLNLSGDELFSLFETHYWLLSNDARTSGAGFLLKEKLASLRVALLKPEN